MRRFNSTIQAVFASILLLASCSFAYAEIQFAAPHMTPPNMVFVLSSKSGSYSNDILTLNNVPLALFYSKNAKKKDGYLDLRDFIRNWDVILKNHENHPVALATLYIYTPTGAIPISIKIKALKFNLDKLTFLIDVIHGAIPQDFRLATLFMHTSSIAALPLSVEYISLDPPITVENILITE